MKQLWILAGGNGAGKSTFYEKRLKPLGLPFINADEIAKQYFPEDPEGSSYRAAKLAEMLRARQLQQGASFCFETVFSHASKIDFIAQAKAMGYQIILIVVHLSTTSLKKVRVKQRVEEGGHSVPEDKIESRIPRLLENIKVAIPLCDEVRVFDNSRLDKPYLPVLTVKQGQVIVEIDPFPGWAANLIAPAAQ